MKNNCFHFNYLIILLIILILAIFILGDYNLKISLIEGYGPFLTGLERSKYETISLITMIEDRMSNTFDQSKTHLPSGSNNKVCESNNEVGFLEESNSSYDSERLRCQMQQDNNYSGAT